MVHVNEFDRSISVQRSTFEPIFLGDKTALIRSDVEDFKVGQVVEINELTGTHHTGRVCEVEITHIDLFCDDMVLLSITLCA